MCIKGLIRVEKLCTPFTPYRANGGGWNLAEYSLSKAICGRLKF